MGVLSRRRFVLGGLVLIGGASLSSCGDPDRRRSINRWDALLESRGIVGDEVEAVGEAYLEAQSEERGLDALLARLPEPQWAAIEQAIEADYREARTVDLLGWNLARTEARLYALSLQL